MLHIVRESLVKRCAQNKFCNVSTLDIEFEKIDLELEKKIERSKFRKVQETKLEKNFFIKCIMRGI